MKPHFRKFLLLAPATALLLAAGAVFADTESTDFENFDLGSVNGQHGWSATGPTSPPPDYDEEIVDPDDFVDIDSFGDRSLRFSNGVADGSFGGWVFAAPLTDAAGDSDAVDTSYPVGAPFPVGTRQPHFEVEFDIASTIPGAEQPGLATWVSPTLGDVGRMSLLKFIDTSAGIDVEFWDVPLTDGVFDASVIATLNRTEPHSIRLTMDFYDGASNDVVNVYIDDVLVSIGTSWENYWRNSAEVTGSNFPRLVRTVIIQARGESVPGVLGFGFLFDNVTMMSGPIVVPPPEDTEDCYGDGWETYNDPGFDSAIECITYVVNNDEYSSRRAMLRALNAEIRRYILSELAPGYEPRTRGGRWY